MIVHHREAPAAPSRVVVLGASGFVGGALTRLLQAQGVASVPVSSGDIDLSQSEAEAQLASLLQPDDVLVFVSALTPDRGKDIATMMKNITMGEHVCAALTAQGGCAQAVYLSSDAVYDDDANPVREDSPRHPSSLYGLMHVVREQMLTQTTAETETPLLVLRPSLLYGVGDTHNAYGPNRFVRVAKDQGQIQLFGQGEEQRDHISVDDTVGLILEGMRHCSAGVLNIATGSSVSFMSLAEMIRQGVGAEVTIDCLPRAMPVTHRHFDIALTREAFPTFSYTETSRGIEALIAGA